MRLRLSPRRLAQNWKLKLAALALSVLLWAVVSAEQVTTQWIPVRVEPQVRDPEFVLTGGPEPAEVRVRFSGAGRELWELALDRPTMTLRVADVGQRRTFVLDPQMVNIPEGLRVRPLDVRPAVVRLDLQRLVTREVPVRLRVGRRSLQRYVLGDAIRVTPAAVMVTGPAEAVAALDALETRAFEVVPDDSTFTGRAAIDTAGLGRITLSHDSVRVAGGVDRRAERALADVAVEAPAGVLAAPARVEVRLSGPERVLRGIDPAALRVRVPADSLASPVPPQGAEAPVRVEGLPAGVAARTVPARVRVAPPASALPPAAPGPGTSPSPLLFPPRSPRR